jgi:hypothetical protein
VVTYLQLSFHQVEVHAIRGRAEAHHPEEHGALLLHEAFGLRVHGDSGLEFQEILYSFEVIRVGVGGHDEFDMGRLEPIFEQHGLELREEVVMARVDEHGYLAVDKVGVAVILCHALPGISEEAIGKFHVLRLRGFDAALGTNGR